MMANVLLKRLFCSPSKHKVTTCCVKQSVSYHNATKSIDSLVEHHKAICSTPIIQTTQQNPEGVFTNSELRLSDIDIIGFDYDYTLAPYSKALEKTIFDMIIERLITTRHYPTELSQLEYNPNFLARGTHYDINEGVFMKVDAYHRIQHESVHHCFRKLDESETLERYPGQRIFFRRDGTSKRFRQIVDIFEIPQLYAWCAVLDYLQAASPTTHPFIVFEDVNSVTFDLHVQGALHDHITANIGSYLEPNPALGSMLEMLRSENKQLFVLTNSPYKFIDIGMTQIIGENWKEYFDVIMCLAKKPKFFGDKYRVFRRLSQDNILTFGEVKELKKGEIYCEGNIRDLLNFTGWNPCKILYFGDQMYADLAEPVLNLGWHTGAIIRELDEEIRLLNSSKYQELLFRLNELDFLIREMQNFLPDSTALHHTDTWCAERKQVRTELRSLHGSSFGSVFRTHLNTTLFYRRLSRFAEIYTSNLTNLVTYHPAYYRFSPIRQNLPHELNSNTLITGSLGVNE